MLDDWRLAFCHNGGHATRQCGGFGRWFWSAKVQIKGDEAGLKGF